MKAKIINITTIDKKADKLIIPFSPGNLAVNICKQVVIPLNSVCRLQLGETDSLDNEEYYQEEDGPDGNTCYDHVIIYSKGKTLEQYIFVVDKGTEANLIYAMIVDNKKGEVETVKINDQSDYLKTITLEQFADIIKQGIKDKVFIPNEDVKHGFNSIKESIINNLKTK